MSGFYIRYNTGLKQVKTDSNVRFFCFAFSAFRMNMKAIWKLRF